VAFGQVGIQVQRPPAFLNRLSNCQQCGGVKSSAARDTWASARLGSKDRALSIAASAFSFHSSFGSHSNNLPCRRAQGPHRRGRSLGQ
jgi:hypothetical protein